MAWTLAGPPARSPIQLGRDDVDAAQDGHDVADHVAFDQLGEDLVIDEAEAGRVRARQGVESPALTM
jgi:hypothetical protein